jgi:transposase
MFRPLTQGQWLALKRQLGRPAPVTRARRRLGGRPRLTDKACFEALLWIVLTGGTWRRLPKRFGSSRAIIPRIYAWESSRVLTRLWRAYLRELPPGYRREIDAAMKRFDARLRPMWQWPLEYVYRLEFKPPSAEQYIRWVLTSSSEVFSTDVENTPDGELELDE